MLTLALTSKFITFTVSPSQKSTTPIWWHTSFWISVVILVTHPVSCSGTLSIISELTNDTVFSTEEAGIDSASAYQLSGHLVLASPLDACVTVDGPPVLNISAPPPHSYILFGIVEQSSLDDCTLAKKAKNAQAAGYSGLILRHLGSNDTSGIIPQFIGLDWIGVRIYVCVLGDEIGGFLMKNYAYPRRYFARFENEPYYPIGLLTNFVIIGFLGILTVLLLLKLFHYLYFSVTTRVVERRRIRKTLLTQSQLKKLPVLKWNPSIPQDTCSICIELFESTEEIRVLPCSHVFHKVCIDPWLLKESRKCPNCKGRVLFPNERGRFTYSSDSDEQSPVEHESGDERTPLLRPRENYRFIDTLTESQNNRTQHYDGHQYSQYLQEDPVEGDAEVDVIQSLPQPQRRKSNSKVTFAPAVSVISSASSNGSSSTSNPGRSNSGIANAFVLPMGPKSVVSSSTSKKPLRRLVINQSPTPISTKTTSTFTPDMIVIHPPPSEGEGSSGMASTSEGKLSPCSSTSSDQTLIDFYNVPNTTDTSLTVTCDEKEASLTASCGSFHSCQEFESEYPSLDGGSYGSFQSSSSGGSNFIN